MSTETYSTTLNREAILSGLEDPALLEKLYRRDKARFQHLFLNVYPEIRHQPIAQFWHERLQPGKQGISWGSTKYLVAAIVITIIAGLLVQIPAFTGNTNQYDVFLQRNMALIIFAALSAYFAYRQSLPLQRLIIPAGLLITAAVYMQFLPDSSKSHTTELACLHLPVLVWGILGFIYSGAQRSTSEKTFGYLQYNGNLVILSGLLTLAGVCFSIIIVQLFALIGLEIADFYAEHIAVWGIAAIPMLSTLLIDNNRQLVSRISPLMARVFTPLVFVALLVFVVALTLKGHHLKDNRDVLLVFNVLLAGVMAIIIFSFSETDSPRAQKFQWFLLAGLGLLTILCNGIALSAISSRISEYGLSPNRLAIVGANLLMFIHLLWLAGSAVLYLNGKRSFESIRHAVVAYLPVYVCWSAIVVFGFPAWYAFR